MQCHTQAGKPAPVFAQTGNRCYECHAAQDPHGGQFRGGERVEDCSTCHTPLRWIVRGFDHDRTRFPLDVAHRNVACANCHKERLPATGAAVRGYRDTPTECVKCH